MGRALERRRRQLEYCRVLLSRRDVRDCGWSYFKKTLKASERKHLYLLGMDDYSLLEREFLGLQNDLDRKAIAARVKLVRSRLVQSPK
jgi:hypothetical protein